MDTVFGARGLVVFALCLLAVAFLSSPAAAQVEGCVIADNCNQGDALSLAQSASAYCATGSGGGWSASPSGPHLHSNGTHSYYSARVVNGGSFNGCTWLSQTEFFFVALTPEICLARPARTGLYQDADPNTPDTYCDEGCTITPILQVPSGNLVWESSGDLCEVGEGNPAPVGDGDSDGTPDDDDAFPTDPDESADSDGDGQGDNGDFAPDDPSNGEDDGEGNESDNQSSGGGTCGAAPSCSGDGIQCNQLFQLWAIRCAVVADGDGGEDDDDEYESPATSGDETASPGDTEILGDTNIGLLDLDDSGWLSRSCPNIPTFNLGPLGTHTPAIDGWCELLQGIGSLIMLLAALIALRILVG